MSVPYTVVAGDTLRLIAIKFGIKDWREIYSAPDNADFRALRPNPDLIFPGDVVNIPVQPTPPSPPPSPPPAPATPPVAPELIKKLIPLVNKTIGKLPVGVIGVKLPTAVRFLDTGEQVEATSVYGSSLDFTHVLISDATGASGRPFTLAVPDGAGTTYAVINAGTLASLAPPSPPKTTASSQLLIHELAHAWQSQHHSDPAAYMTNSVSSQTAAAVDAPVAKAEAAKNALTHFGDPIAAAQNEDVSAYAYVPGKPFSQYAAEQQAQQVEDAYKAGKTGSDPIASHMRAVAAHAVDADNVTAMATTRFERKSTPGVVFH